MNGVQTSNGADRCTATIDGRNLAQTCRRIIRCNTANDAIRCILRVEPAILRNRRGWESNRNHRRRCIDKRDAPRRVGRFVVIIIQRNRLIVAHRNGPTEVGINRVRAWRQRHNANTRTAGEKVVVKRVESVDANPASAPVAGALAVSAAWPKAEKSTTIWAWTSASCWGGNWRVRIWRRGRPSSPTHSSPAPTRSRK